jgi:hypothetical protein
VLDNIQIREHNKTNKKRKLGHYLKILILAAQLLPTFSELKILSGWKWGWDREAHVCNLERNLGE